MKPKFGVRYRQLRQARGYSLRSVAEAVSCSATYLSHVERNLNGNVATVELAEGLMSAIELTDDEKAELIALLHWERCPTCGGRLSR